MNAADSSQAVAQASEEQLALMEEISNASRMLGDMTQELQGLIQQFKLTE
jgi:methyl-accepting chemotaxis protein